MQLCQLLQNDIGEENDNDGFIIPRTQIAPEAGSSHTGLLLLLKDSI